MEVITFWTRMMFISFGVLFVVAMFTIIVDPVASGIRSANRQIARQNKREEKKGKNNVRSS